MLGYPRHWFDVDGLSRTTKLRALGNSVQVQVAFKVGIWFAGLLEAGLLRAPEPVVDGVVAVDALRTAAEGASC